MNTLNSLNSLNSFSITFKNSKQCSRKGFHGKTLQTVQVFQTIGVNTYT
jgi:hypothetical protein